MTGPMHPSWFYKPKDASTRYTNRFWRSGIMFEDAWLSKFLVLLCNRIVYLVETRVVLLSILVFIRKCPVLHTRRLKWPHVITSWTAEDVFRYCLSFSVLYALNWTHTNFLFHFYKIRLWSSRSISRICLPLFLPTIENTAVSSTLIQLTGKITSYNLALLYVTNNRRYLHLSYPNIAL